MIARIPILVITPTSGFGELIQQTLEDTGNYQVVLVDNAATALSCARTMPISLCILDCTPHLTSQVDLAVSLRKLQPQMRLVIIPPDDDPGQTALSQIRPYATLSKPFYLPDLLDTVKEGLYSVGLSDASQAAQHLTRLSLESSAQAAMIVREGQLWAYAGQLSQEAAQELASIVLTSSINDEKDQSLSAKTSDRLRFVRLSVTGGEYMLYIISLSKTELLALAFASETPFSKIRAKAGQLAKDLASPGAMTSTKSNAPSAQSPATAQIPSLSSSKPELQPLLENVPSHLPPSGHTRAAPSLNIPTTPSVQPFSAVSSNIRQTLAQQPVAQPTQSAADISEPFVSVSGLRVTSPPERKAEELPSTSLVVHALHYACAIIPRMPNHTLSGDLADKLPEWMGRLCLAFGWRLEYLSVQPEALQWVANLSPSIPPGRMIRSLRKHTSQLIFTAFPNLARENPSGDFWAPGYLITSGSAPPPANVLAKFIQQTRSHQGIRTISRRLP